MSQSHPGHPGDGSFATAPALAFDSLARFLLPPLSPVLLQCVANKDLAKLKRRALTKGGGLDSSLDAKTWSSERADSRGRC